MKEREGDASPARSGAGRPGPGGRPARMPFRLSRRAGRAYQGVLEAVLAIPVGMGLGYGADYLLGIQPVGILGGLAVGFAAFALRLNRMRVLLDAEVAREGQAERAEGGGSEESGGNAERWERR